MKPVYIYLVGFTGRSGFGRVEIATREPLTHIGQIDSLDGLVDRETGQRGAVIISATLLRTEP